MLFRVYFNRHRDAPQVCSVDEGTQDSEINVCGFITRENVVTQSRYNGTKANAISPSFWVEVRATRMTVINGIAVFE